MDRMRCLPCTFVLALVAARAVAVAVPMAWAAAWACAFASCPFFTYMYTGTVPVTVMQRTCSCSMLPTCCLQEFLHFY